MVLWSTVCGRKTPAKINWHVRILSGGPLLIYVLYIATRKVREILLNIELQAWGVDRGGRGGGGRIAGGEFVGAVDSDMKPVLL